MKHLLLTIIAAVVLVGCVTMLPQDLAIFDAVEKGDIEAVKQHLDAGTNVNAKIEGGVFSGRTPLDLAWLTRQTATADLLRKHGGKTKKELEAAGN